MVVAEKADFFEDALKLRDYAPVLTDWLRRNFKIAFTVDVDRHWFLERRPEPLPKRERISLTSHCRVRRNVFGRRVVRSHLLFDSLYHRFGTGHIKGPQEIMTSCTVVVPKHASLRLAIGYRQPLKVGSGTTLKNEVWVLPPVYNEKTMRPRIEDWVRVDPPFDWASPPPREYSVDLSGLAGDEVMIGFRTVFSGEVDTNPLDAEGFAATIHDPRIEFESAAPGTDR